jgi:hypothetical protein
MRRIALFLFAMLLVGTLNARAQSRLYVGATSAVDGGNRGNIPGGAIPSAGGLVGFQVTDTWSIEAEVERGFRTTTSGSGEGLWVSFPPSQNPTREEIELYGVRARFDRTQTARTGWSTQAVWRGREIRRVNAGFLAGVSSRAYTSRVVRTITSISPLVPAFQTDRLSDETSTRRMAGTGLTGGVLVFIRVTRQLTVAPEVRMTTGFMTNDRYTVVRSGIRAMWRF